MNIEQVEELCEEIRAGASTSDVVQWLADFSSAELAAARAELERLRNERCTCDEEGPAHHPDCIVMVRETLAAARAEVERLSLLVFAPMGDNHHNAAKCPHCRNASAEAEAARLRAAILWALGEEGEFSEEPPPLVGKYRQRYWWRTELRKRAALAQEGV